MDEVLQLKEQLKEKERELALLKNKLAQLEKVKPNAILMNSLLPPIDDDGDCL